MITRLTDLLRITDRNRIASTSVLASGTNCFCDDRRSLQRPVIHALIRFDLRLYRQPSAIKLTVKGLHLCAPLPLAKLYLPELDSLFSLTTSPTAPSRSLSSGWMQQGIALDLQTGVPIYQVEDGLPRRRLAGGGSKAECIY